MAGDLDDGALARAVTAGAPGADAELYRRFAARVRAYGLRHLRDGAAAADLVQSVLTLVLDKLRAGAVDGPAQIASFVLGVCRHTVTDWRRTERRRQALLDQAAPALAERDLSAPVSPIDRRRLAGCLDALPPRQRTVVMLTYYADRDGDEVARELGASAGNVRVLRHRALAALHDCMTGGAP